MRVFFLYHLNSSVNSQGIMDSTCVFQAGKMGDGCEVVKADPHVHVHLAATTDLQT